MTKPTATFTVDHINPDDLEAAFMVMSVLNKPEKVEPLTYDGTITMTKRDGTRETIKGTWRIERWKRTTSAPPSSS